MIEAVLNRIKSILDGEIATGGRLETVKMVQIGDYKEPAATMYPYIAIHCEGIDFDGFNNPSSAMLTVNGSIIIYVSSLASIEAVERARDNLLWEDRTGKPPAGVLPTLLKNLVQFEITPNKYFMDIGTVRREVTGEKSKFIAGAEIPFVVKTHRQII